MMGLVLELLLGDAVLRIRSFNTMLYNLFVSIYRRPVHNLLGGRFYIGIIPIPNHFHMYLFAYLVLGPILSTDVGVLKTYFST